MAGSPPDRQTPDRRLPDAALPDGPGRPGWGWGRWLLLAVTLLAWTPVLIWATGLILADLSGCEVRADVRPCPTGFGDIGGFLHAITVFGGWTMIPAGIVMLPTGMIWCGLFIAWAVRRLRGAR